MQSTLACPSLELAKGFCLRSLNVVTIYEDYETGRHSRRTYDFLSGHLGADFSLSHQMWKFEVLRSPKMCALAARDAINADLILVSSRGGDHLPMEVQHWIERWLSEPLHALALMALFVLPRDSRDRARPIRSYLAEIARRGQMEFFGQPDEWPLHPGASTLLGYPPQLLARAFSTLRSATQQEAVLPRWGLNE